MVTLFIQIFTWIYFHKSTIVRQINPRENLWDFDWIFGILRIYEIFLTFFTLSIDFGGIWKGVLGSFFYLFFGWGGVRRDAFS